MIDFTQEERQYVALHYPGLGVNPISLGIWSDMLKRHTLTDIRNYADSAHISEKLDDVPESVIGEALSEPFGYTDMRTLLDVVRHHDKSLIIEYFKRYDGMMTIKGTNPMYPHSAMGIIMRLHVMDMYPIDKKYDYATDAMHHIYMRDLKVDRHTIVNDETPLMLIKALVNGPKIETLQQLDFLYKYYPGFGGNLLGERIDHGYFNDLMPKSDQAYEHGRTPAYVCAKVLGLSLRPDFMPYRQLMQAINNEPWSDEDSNWLTKAYNRTTNFWDTDPNKYHPGIRIKTLFRAISNGRIEPHTLVSAIAQLYRLGFIEPNTKVYYTENELTGCTTLNRLIARPVECGDMKPLE